MKLTVTEFSTPYIPGFRISTPNQIPSANSAVPMNRTTPSSPLTSTLRPWGKEDEKIKHKRPERGSMQTQGGINSFPQENIK